MSSTPLDEQIRALTEGGKLLVDYQIKVLKGQLGADVAEVQKAIDWLTQRGWGRASDNVETEKATAVASNVTTADLLTILQKVTSK